jgi:hypothetical protein
MLDRIKFLLFRRPGLARRGVIAARSANCDGASTFARRNTIAGGARIVPSRLGLASYMAEKGFLIRTSVGRFCSVAPIVGAGSVVTRDVPPYAVVAGGAARVMQYRFDGDTIQRLLRSAWWELDFPLIAQLAPRFAPAESLLRAVEATPEPVAVGH